MKLHPPRALLSALQATGRPITFMVGSAMSADFSGAGRGVPGAAEVAKLARAKVEARRPTDLDAFDAQLTSADNDYQAALEFVGGWLGQDTVNEIIADAVLRACRRPGKFRDPHAHVDDSDPAHWWLPPGIADLGELLVQAPERYRGPILTTNFDPLIEAGIRAAGGQARRSVIDGDGNLPASVDDAPGELRVVHLHGYWRYSDTLHTADQLTSPRPRLSASLRRVLEDHLVVAIGYGGWDDVFTAALAELLHDSRARLELVWCFHETDERLVAARYGALLDKLSDAITRGRLRTYGGIDCHEILGKLRTATSTATTTTTATSAPPPASTPLPDWTLVDPPYLDAIPLLEDRELQRYFDGQVPTWRHALTPALPRRQVVATLVEQLEQEAALVQLSFHVLLGAGGEGKSTVLLQVAADIARLGTWRVLWRPEPGVPLPPDAADQLARDDTPWLLVSDDGEELVSSLRQLLHRAHTSGRKDIHVLVAARDTDWVAAGGYAAPWRSFAPSYTDPTRLRGLTHEDAEVLVTAWEQLGDDGLGALAKFADRDARVQALEHAVSVEAKRGAGSFFGGLLEARLGREGLREHLVGLLDHLAQLPISHSTATLADALMYVACCHGCGLAGIDERVLAQLLDVEPLRIHRDVIKPLGDEAAGVRSARHVYTRHAKVATALLVIGHERVGFDLAELWSAIIRCVATVRHDYRMSQTWYSSVVHIGPRLAEVLPAALRHTDRTEIALRVAQEAAHSLFDQASCTIDLARTLRATKRAHEGAQIMAASFERLSAQAEDWDTVVRGYIYEWAVCAAEAKLPINVWMAGLSICDELFDGPIDVKRATMSLAGLGQGFAKRAQAGDRWVNTRARSAAAYLGLAAKPSDKVTWGYLKDHAAASRSAGVTPPKSVSEALEWLREGLARARPETFGEALPAVVTVDSLSFERLAKLISNP